MGTVSGPWAGQLYGDEPGELYAELSGSDEAVAGVLSIHRRSGDIEILNGSGAYGGGRLELVCRSAAPGDPERRLSGALGGDGELTGELADAGGAAAFVLFPHRKDEAPDAPEPRL